MQIITGKQAAPIRAVVYGPEGIGKSTLASHWPKPLFVDVEQGTSRLDVARIRPLSWAAVGQAVAEIEHDGNGFQTVVFDTADWLEKLAAAAVCAAHGQKGIEAFGYGKGYTYLADEWKRFLDALSAMQAKTGTHVLFLAHACMRKFEQPDEAGAYDRWELKLSKQVAPVLKEWADLVLFLNYETIVVEADGKHKAQGGKRVIHTTHHPCWDAKNRFDLPDKFALGNNGLPAELRPVFADVTTERTTASAPSPAPAEADPPAPAPQTAETAATDPARSALLDQLRQLMVADGIKLPELQAELARKGVVPADMHPTQYNEATLSRVVGRWSAVVHNIKVARAAA